MPTKKRNMKSGLKLIVLAAVVLFSSCSSNMLIVKRKYNNGYYVNSGGKVKKQEIAAPKSEDLQKTDILIAKQQDVAITPEMPVSASADKSILVLKNHNALAPLQTPVESEQSKEVVSSKEQRAIAKIEKKTKRAEVRFAKKQKRAVDADSHLILLVIFSLFPFFALLAVYLKDGKMITTNFWVDLLLHLTVVGYAIYALLVVFDIVNLA